MAVTNSFAHFSLPVIYFMDTPINRGYPLLYSLIFRSTNDNTTTNYQGKQWLCSSKAQCRIIQRARVLFLPPLSQFNMNATLYFGLLTT